MIKTTLALPSLEECLHYSARLDGMKPTHQRDFMARWERFLPEYVGGQGGMEYRPVPLQKKLMPDTDDPNHLSLPYFFLLYNPARDERPIQTMKPEEAPKQEEEGLDPLERNLIRKGIIMYGDEFEDWYITPNGFPINMYHCLIITKQTDRETFRRQSVPSFEDLEFAMLYSQLFDALVIFNPFGGGGTIDRFHFQSFYPAEFGVEGKTVDIPIRASKKEPVSGSSDVYTMTDYPATNIIFRGMNAPEYASRLSQRLYNNQHPSNIVVDHQDIHLFPRFPPEQKRQAAPATDKNVAGLEVSGIFVVGNIKQKVVDGDGNPITDSGGKPREEVLCWGNDIYNAFTYEKARRSLAYTVCPRDDLSPEKLLNFI